MSDALATVTLDGYRFPVIGFDCPRCKRNAEAEVAKLRGKFGGKLTLGEVARQVAAGRGCALAQDADHSLCSVRAVAPPVHHWAELDHARLGGWTALLHCGRRHEALKTAKSCPGAVPLDVPTLIAALGHNFPLERLPSRLLCPSCGSKSLGVEWIVPPEPPPSGGATQTPEPVRLRPTRAALGGRRFRVVEGG
jgi:hypothetical protein